MTSGRSSQIRDKNGSKTINSNFGKKIIDERIKQVPNLYKYRIFKIKSNNLRKVIDSDIANYAVTEHRTGQKTI